MYFVLVVLDISCNDGCRGGVVYFNGVVSCDVGGGYCVVLVFVVLVGMVRVGLIVLEVAIVIVVRS